MLPHLSHGLTTCLLTLNHLPPCPETVPASPIFYPKLTNQHLFAAAALACLAGAFECALLDKRNAAAASSERSKTHKSSRKPGTTLALYCWVRSQTSETRVRTRKVLHLEHQYVSSDRHQSPLHGLDLCELESDRPMRMELQCQWMGGQGQGISTIPSNDVNWREVKKEPLQ